MNKAGIGSSKHNSKIYDNNVSILNHSDMQDKLDNYQQKLN